MARARISDTFFHKQHLQCLPAKEAECSIFSLQQAGLDCKLASGVCLPHWRCTIHDKFHLDLYIAAGVWKDSQLPILKILLQVVFLTAHLSDRYEFESCLICVS